MNARELKVKKKLEAEGYKVLRGGAPDFIALKVDPSGKILSFKGVEVKSRGNGFKLSYEQEVYRKLFQLAKIEFEVEVV